MNNLQTYSITHLRQNAAKVINNVYKGQEPAIILQRSKPKAVIVRLDYFQALEEAVADLTDNQAAEKAKKEPVSSFKNYLKKRWGTSKL